MPTYARTMFRGATRTILFSSRRERRTVNGLGDTDIRRFFRKRGDRSGTPGEGLPMLCRPGEVRTTPQKRKCRLANHSNGNRGALPFFGPVPWLWVYMVYISRTSSDLSKLFHVERFFIRWHNNDYRFFSAPGEGLPMLCRPGEVRTTPQKRKCRLANNTNGNRGALPFFGPVPWIWVYISRTSPDLSRLFHVERVFLDHLFFSAWPDARTSGPASRHCASADSTPGEHQCRFQPTTENHPFSIGTPPLAPTALPVARLRYRPHPERRQTRQ